MNGIDLDLELVFPDGSTAHASRLTKKDDCPRLWTYKGKTYADNLFRLHDEKGIPLGIAVQLCRDYGLIPCLMQFRSEAQAAGWSQQHIENTIREAEVDND